MAFVAEALVPSRAEAAIAEAITPAEQAPHLRLRGVRVTRHKPGRRCLIEYEFDGPGAAESLTVVGKVRAKGLDEPSHRVLRSLWEQGFEDVSPDGLSVPRPLGMIPRFNMTLQQKVPGVPLALMVGGPEGVAFVRRAADLIHKLHATRLRSPRRHGINDEVRILHERLPRVADADPRLRPPIDRLLAACERIAFARNASAAVAATGIHRDFYADQVVVDGGPDGRLYLLDLDLFAEGDPALDVGNFVAHLTELALRTTGDATAFAGHERAMVQRYAELANGGGDLLYNIGAYACLTLARHVHISTLFPDRRPFTSALLELAERRVSALESQA